MNYGIKLKEVRIKNNKTQKELANVLKLSEITYSHYETQDNIIPIKHLNTLCYYLNVSMDYIFNFTNIQTYSNLNNEIDTVLSGNRIKEFRKENNLTQDKLSKYLNTDKSTICKYEKGIHILSTSFLYAICKKYNISADYLLGRIDEPKYLK